MIYSYSKHLVLCYINIGSGYICNYLPWSKYPSNGTTSDCSKHQAVNKYAALLLSIGSVDPILSNKAAYLFTVHVFGLNNFYTCNFFDGAFVALVQGLITTDAINIDIIMYMALQ